MSRQSMRPLAVVLTIGLLLAAHPSGAAAQQNTCAGRPATIIGQGRFDGTPDNDVILGSNDRDEIDGRGGDDVICGGAGSDVLRGGGGNDELHGDFGYDDLYGGDGDDLLVGGFNGRGSRHIAMPEETPIANMMLALSRHYGVELESYGISTGSVDLVNG